MRDAGRPAPRPSAAARLRPAGLLPTSDQVATTPLPGAAMDLETSASGIRYLISRARCPEAPGHASSSRPATSRAPPSRCSAAWNVPTGRRSRQRQPGRPAPCASSATLRALIRIHERLSAPAWSCLHRIEADSNLWWCAPASSAAAHHAARPSSRRRTVYTLTWTAEYAMPRQLSARLGSGTTDIDGTFTACPWSRRLNGGTALVTVKMP